jgi:hypothetical protein
MTQIKEKLLAEIEALPEHRVADVIEYIHYLQYQERHLYRGEGPAVTIADSDPMRQYIGGVEHGSLAQNIDEDVYPS